jgi:hypothetical protein
LNRVDSDPFNNVIHIKREENANGYIYQQHKRTTANKPPGPLTGFPDNFQ